MSWLKEVIGTEKAIIAMCHMQAMPGDPGYDGQKGMDWVIKKMYDDLIALQNGGVDSVMFSNEFSLPYIDQGGYDYSGIHGHCHWGTETLYQDSFWG